MKCSRDRFETCPYQDNIIHIAGLKNQSATR